MITLYYRPNSCALSEHIVLEWIGEPYESVLAQRDDTAYLALNPKGSVPAMRDGSGPVMTQNDALLQYLAQKHPGAGIAGDGSLEQTYQINHWLAFIGCDLHPAYKPLFAPTFFTTKHDEESIAAAKAAAKARVEHELAHLERGLTDREYLVGNQKSIADAYAFAVSRWYGRMFGSLDAFPHIRAFQERMLRDPAVAKAVAIHNPV